MKIIHIISGLGLGGVESILHQLLAKMSESDDQYFVISLLDKGEKGQVISDLGIPVYELNLPNPMSFFRLRKLIKTIQPDLIVGWMYHGNLAASLASFMARKTVPVCWNIHYSLHDLSAEKWMTRQVLRLNRILSDHPDAIVYVASSGAKHHEQAGFNSQKTKVIPNGFDCDLFHPQSMQKQKITRKRFNLEQDVFLIGLVARYHSVKDQKTFLEAAGKLLLQKPDIKFVMVGTDIDHSNMELMALIKKLKLSSAVTLLGECHEIPDLMAALDILSLSSVSEAFPNVLGEAMACGVPCVATDVGDCAEIIADTGAVVAVKDSDAMAAAWMKIIEMDSGAKVELGESARRRIATVFSLTEIVKQHENLYKKCVSSFSSSEQKKASK